MNKELAEAVKLFISQPLNFPLSRGQIMEVARIALPILEQQERGEGEWLHLNGVMALPPVGSHVQVEVKLRNGDLVERKAQDFAWRNSPVKKPFDIIAYRIIPGWEESCSN